TGRPSKPHPHSSICKVSVGESAGVEVVTLPGGQTIHVQGVIQTTQPSVIQSPQIQTIQVGATADGEETDVSETQKRRELLSRRPSYRKILSELSSDTPAVPKIEEEEKAEEDIPASTSVATVTVPSSIYQTSSGQYSKCKSGQSPQSYICTANTCSSVNIKKHTESHIFGPNLCYFQMWY
uniref:KID domain-containing protein n=1 Tax=Astyanax mexicanus TaxID=7994 RepID=A0A8B9LF86_ASTMX